MPVNRLVFDKPDWTVGRVGDVEIAVGVHIRIQNVCLLFHIHHRPGLLGADRRLRSGAVLARFGALESPCDVDSDKIIEYKNKCEKQKSQKSFSHNLFQHLRPP